MRTWFWRVTGLGLALAALLGAACGDRGVPCETLCQRARTCRAELGEARRARLPQKSAALRHVRQELPGRLLDRVLGTCGVRCTTLRRNQRFRIALQRCRATKSCQEFASCLEPMLEP